MDTNKYGLQKESAIAPRSIVALRMPRLRSMSGPARDEGDGEGQADGDADGRAVRRAKRGADADRHGETGGPSSILAG